MNEVLGRTAGNAVEVREAIDHMTGALYDDRLTEVTLALCAEVLVLGGVHPDLIRAREAADQALRGGAAAERFAQMVAALGGPANLIEAPSAHLRSAPVTLTASAIEPGFVTAVDVRAVGIAIVALGGGRAREDDAVDHTAGLTEVAALGERVGPGERPLAVVHARDEGGAERAVEAIRSAYTVGEAAPPLHDPVIETYRTV